jgi:hypothetical protein
MWGKIIEIGGIGEIGSMKIKYIYGTCKLWMHMRTIQDYSTIYKSNHASKISMFIYIYNNNTFYQNKNN